MTMKEGFLIIKCCRKLI